MAATPLYAYVNPIPKKYISTDIDLQISKTLFYNMQEVTSKAYVYKAVHVLHVFYFYEKNVNLLCLMIYEKCLNDA